MFFSWRLNGYFCVLMIVNIINKFIISVWLEINNARGSLVVLCFIFVIFRTTKPFSFSSNLVSSTLIEWWRFLITTRNALSCFSWYVWRMMFLSFKNFNNFLKAYIIETLILIFEFFMALHINSFLFIILDMLFTISLKLETSYI